MKHFKNVVFLLLFINQLMIVLCQMPIADGGTDTMYITSTYSKEYTFAYSSGDANHILHLTSATTDPAYPGYIYASCTGAVSEDNRMFSSQEYDKNELYINLGHADCSSGTTLNILLKAPGSKASTTITLKANLITGIELDDTNKKAKFKMTHIQSVTYKRPSTLSYNKILIYGLGENVKYFSMTVQHGTSSTPIAVKQRFENGYGAIVDLNTIPAEEVITITISSTNTNYEKTKVEVGFEMMDQKETHKRQIKLLEHVYGAVTNALETCYTVPEAVLTKSPVLLINVYSQAVSFIVKKNSDNTKQYSQDGFHNSFIRLLEPFNNTNYFCIRNYIPKTGNTPLLSEATYDFQLYYESELSTTQMFIMPLINGKIYTHSLNRGSVMVYRHNFYPGETLSVYSANLLRIRGNPKLYGLACNSYPDCKVTSQTAGLQEIEVINQYYINKISSTFGNVVTDANGEPVSDLRRQYMSVVICDTSESDPNYGECKYTIEINNNGDEIQLLPERVFTTSLIPGTQNFYVRISNYETLKKLNITLTVLTGNAYMKLYSTSLRSTGTDNEINDYNHHKIFRREVFEFIKPEDYTGTTPFIKQEYFGEIIASENSFIELKYVTDFHFKGYIMTNPGEVNIEYINKKGSQFPYEIQNPYYYHPLNENLNKNKDYMFKIRSKECSMFYNYNYNNMPMTSKVDMQFDRSQPYTYLTSFAFMTTVDNYNYNEKTENTDCPMFIYSGEINNKDRPLLLVSDVAVSSTFENSYFIYPYLRGNFLGIMIGIKLLGSNRPTFQVSVTIKKSDGTSVNIIAPENINSDKSYYIGAGHSTIDCGDNIQCALRINIEGVAGNSGTNPISVIVSSLHPSVPEIIDKSESSGNIYVPYSDGRIIKTSIGQYDDTEFKFTCTTGTPTIEAKLITKEEVNNIQDFKNDFNTITGIPGVSINYDSTSKTLQLSSSQTSSCSSGCFLLMKIDLPDNTAAEVHIVSFTQKQMDIGLTSGTQTTNNLPPSYERLFTFSYTTTDIATNKILHLSSTPLNFAYPGYIYASFEENVSEDNRLFSSQDIGTNQLYIDLSKYSGKNKLYILVKAPKKENANTVTLRAELIPEVVLSNTNPKARFKLSHNSKVLIDPSSITPKSNILIYGLGEDWNFFEMKASYETSRGSTRKINIKQIFHNGYGAIVDLNRIPSGKKIQIDLSASTDSAKERKVEIGFEFADQETDYMRPVNILEHVYGATSYSENCYEMAENVDKSKNPVLLINAFSQAVSFVVKEKTTHERKYSQDGFHNSFIRLLETFDKANHYFCIKKFTPKDRLEEELGESSYDFQLYYEDDLPNNQMFIMPLINGKIYTHSLNLGSVMVYRHSVFTGYSNSNENKIYSANLLKIRGNPKLYGYVCETYPDCVVTKDTEGLEEIERINQYYVNKRLNAIGNTDIDANGEPVSEIRKQYLSVVICDSQYSDPNYGECKYTIEINNEREDIQLIPERVFATSVLPGKNYFSVRVSNHQDVSKLNITLTVLTGNAYMNIFSDYDNTQKITDYNHHKIFRREVFEFPSSRIREVYWGEIECTEPAFIELKYVTDFHFKGYIMTNPGEVNIEYINKKGSQFPYEIQNPYYYHPLNENLNKNKDYMFKIRSKECSMFYNYNYNNMPMTSKVDMQFDRSQPYTYLTSFAFMTTVDNYNYNNQDDSTDCAMLIYSGEINSPERPLLIISDFPLPSDFNNTYYIYPFIKNSDFKGLLVDIRFTDNTNGNPSYKVKLSVSGTNVLNEATITKDEMFNIEATNNKINCGNNLQCALKIEIEKTPESDRAYNLTVNVYPPTTSIPEVIDTAESNSAKLYIKSGEVKKTQLSIGKNEETEIKFNFNSGTGKVFAILIPKSQNDGSYNSIIFDENTSNLLSFNANSLRLTKEDTEICDGGCDLIIQMSVEGATEEFVEVSITKDPINAVQPGEEEDDDDDKGVKPWLVAVIVIVCVVAVAGALILVYFLVLKKKAGSNISRPIEESENKFKGNNDIISKDRVKVINFNN